VPSDALAAYQEENDVMMAEQTLRNAYETDIRPLVAEARRLAGGAIDPIHAFRRSDYREKMGMAREQGSYTPPASL
jgi:L-rhamnose isomerase/sugar isomerase